MKKKTRKIVVIVGSKSDFRQCTQGLKKLRDYAEEDQAQAKVVFVKSVHRHTEKLFALLRALSADGKTDVIIAGAGKAAHLPGCVDAYLRNQLHDTKIQVMGVAFRSKDSQDNDAAILSITRVPGTQVIFAGLGSDGFSNACQTACNLEDFQAITLKDIPPDMELTLDQAIKLAGEVT